MRAPLRSCLALVFALGVGSLSIAIAAEPTLLEVVERGDRRHLRGRDHDFADVLSRRLGEVHE